jgi:autotransporter-associated beta strand protein
MNIRKFLLLSLFSIALLTVNAQRKYQTLDRGVVACNNVETSSNPVFISWRLFAQDPENIRFNIYCKAGGTGDYVLLNTEGPVTKTNYSTTYAKVPNNSLLCVAPVTGEFEGTKSIPFKYIQRSYRSIFIDMTYDGFLSSTDYSTKFIWPADLDGDGEYDYVVDRLSLNGSTHKVEAYLRTGERLWTIDMGPNVLISQGHNDMVVAYDMNCDGKSEVVIKSSDGTRFWDSTGKTWGKYLKNAANGDTDNDGIIDYTTQTVKNPPQYITVVNGMTGEEMSTIEMPYPNDASNTYTRTNKANYMGDDYSNLGGHMGIAYLDGVHPSVVMEYMCRAASSQFHFYYVTAWGYKFVNGVATDWEQKYTWNRDYQNAAEFHQIRIADVDFDGKDEMIEGGYTLNDDGKLLFSANISHGDRFRTGDINPSRPGLETFAIQQNAGDMLGQILYDAGTGSAIKKWYLASVGDVGRGECIDIDKKYKGYEMWSTMGNIYNCEGDIIYKGSVDMPKEGVWWDGELDREILDAKDGNGYNAMITKYAGNGSYQNNRLIQFASMMNWTVNAEYGCRPAFFGDIAGDWREEVLLEKTNYSGFIGFTTDYPTDIRLYCLMQDPAYRMQTTTKGYYQSPFPDFYLGYDMQQPPLPPMMKTDLVWKSGAKWDVASSNFTGYDEKVNQPFENGKSVLFDISGNNSGTVQLEGSISPSILYVMTPIGHDYVFGGTGSITGTTELWKSQNGRLILNGNHTYTGKTIISEGILELNGSLQSKIDLRAKGTIAGNAVLNGGVQSEPGLNYEGGRFSPGTVTSKFGKITVNGDLSLGGGIYLEMNLQTKGTAANDTLIKFDTIDVKGNLTLSGVNYVHVVSSEEKPFAGKYPVLTWSGNINGDISNFSITGLKGLSTDLVIEGKTLYLIVNGQRAAQTGVIWTGTESAIWDFNAENFSIAGEKVSFVNGDQVIFNDDPPLKTITLGEFVQTSGVTVDCSAYNYTFSGTTGGISGTGGITKEGTGALRLLAEKSDYTGPTKVNGGILEVTALADGGLESSIGKASASVSNLILDGSTLKINSANTATNRGITLLDTATIEVSQSSSYATLKGIITGSGMLVKAGPGQLSQTYDGANTYTGGTLVKAGSLAMGTWHSTFGTLGSKLEIQGTSSVSIFNNNSTSYVPVFNYAVVVPTGSNVYLYAGQRCKINGSLSGGGIMTLNLPYVRADLIGNWSAFQGTLNVTGSQFRLCNSNGLQNASVNLGDDLTMGHFAEGSASALSGTSKIGSLGGNATSNLCNGTYNIGYNNADAIFRGVIAAGVTVNKYGTGKWTLTNANLCSSAFTIYGGTVYAGNTTGSATGTGPVTVKTGSALDGTGTISGAVTVEGGGKLMGNLTIGGLITVKSGSSITPGSTTLTYARKITAKGSLTLQKGCSVNMKVFGGVSATCDQLAVSGTFTPAGILRITAPTKSIITEGSSFQLFSAATIASSRFDSIILPESSNVTEWDTTLLYTEGKIVAKVVTSVDEAQTAGPLSIYPTDVDQVCTVHTGAFNGKGILKIFNGEGLVIYSTEMLSGETKDISLDDNAPGVYLVTLKTEEGSYTRKLIKR